jgi:hypothetical protein
VSGHQRLAVRRQLPQKTDPDAGRLLGVVFEAVVPIGVLEPDLEHGVFFGLWRVLSEIPSARCNSFFDATPCNATVRSGGDENAAPLIGSFL